MKNFKILLGLFLGMAFLSHLHAQDRTVRLLFTPPELDGHFSIGVFDAKGKIVRTLFADAPPAYFQIGLNGYQISWDGNTDDGTPAPAGKYSAHGYVVGDVKVEGEAFHFNDWVTAENEPIVQRITGIKTYEKDDAIIEAKTKDATIYLSANGTTGDVRILPKGSGFKPEDRETPKPPAILAAKEILSSTYAAGNWWAVINRGEGGAPATSIGEFTQAGDFIRELHQAPDEPPFSKVTVNDKSPLVWTFSEDKDRQIVRALKPSAIIDGKTADDATANWEIVFERNLQNCAHFGFKDNAIVPSVEGDLASPPINVRLIKNDLEPDTTPSILLRPLQRPNGGWIATTDGLPLVRVSETPSPRCALLLGSQPGFARWYQLQADAVVEEYHIEGLENLAKFDIGDFDLE